MEAVIMTSSARPNIVFITSHDTGDWLGCYGHDTLQTPHIDELAAGGCRVEASFCTSPVCTPSRGALMTGRYPQSNGLMGLIQTPYRWRFREGEQHLSHLLKDAGYRTVLFNHQHEADSDDSLGFLETRIHDVGNTQLLTGERVSTASETAEAFRAFLRDPEDARPFYAQIGFFETHTSYDWNGAVPDRSKGLEVPPFVVDDREAREHIAALQGSIASLDNAVGTIIESLRETELLDNTIVVFTVDHGIEFPRCKWELYDGGIRTALLFRGPGGIVGGGTVYPGLVSNVDIIPTLLDLVDIPRPDNVQGKSFSSHLVSSYSIPHRDAIFAMMHGSNRWSESRCVRTERYKLIRNFTPTRSSLLPIKISGPNTQQERPVVELYDLEKDPFELDNVAQQEAFVSTREELDNKLRLWMEEVEDPILSGPVRTPYYQMAMDDFGLIDEKR